MNNTVEEWAELVERYNATKKGWTDSPEYIRNPINRSFRIAGRWFIKRDDGTAECIE